ncbi:hypothetical protein L9F63_017772, partial [Diploptera punctata]
TIRNYLHMSIIIFVPIIIFLCCICCRFGIYASTQSKRVIQARTAVAVIRVPEDTNVTQSRAHTQSSTPP